MPMLVAWRRVSAKHTSDNLGLTGIDLDLGLYGNELVNLNTFYNVGYTM